jgi:hypothetical protein
MTATDSPTLLSLAPKLFTPANCPHCEYDRQFPETANGGWVYMGNNAPIGPCPMCNPDGSHPRSALEDGHE